MKLIATGMKMRSLEILEALRLSRLLAFATGSLFGVLTIKTGICSSPAVVVGLMVLLYCWSFMPLPLLLGTAGRLTAGAGLVLSVLAVAFFKLQGATLRDMALNGLTAGLLASAFAFAVCEALLLYSTFLAFDRVTRSKGEEKKVKRPVALLILSSRLFTLAIFLLHGVGMLFWGICGIESLGWALMIISLCWTLVPRHMLLGTFGKLTASAGLALSVLQVTQYGPGELAALQTTAFALLVALVVYSTFANVYQPSSGMPTTAE